MGMAANCEYLLIMLAFRAKPQAQSVNYVFAYSHQPTRLLFAN